MENWLGLVINRDKTRVVNLSEEDTWLDVLGYRFRYERALCGRDHRYLNLQPAEKSLARERETLRQMTGPSMCFKPIRWLVWEMDRHLKGWREYFGLGYPRRAFRKTGWCSSCNL